MNVDWDKLEQQALAGAHCKQAKVYSVPLHRTPRFNKCWCGSVIKRAAKACRLHYRKLATAGLALATLCSNAATNINMNPVASPPVTNTVPITLAWDSSQSAEAVGYKLYYGTASGVYTHIITVGNVTNATLDGLLLGTKYYFAATAYNTNFEESVFSNEIGVTAGYDTIVTITSRRSTSPVGPWTNAAVVWKATNSPIASLYVDHLIGRTTRLTWK